MATVTPKPTTKHVEESLRSLRGKLTTWFVVEGLSRLLLCLLVVIALDVWIDWQFNLDRAQRVAMLLLALVPLAWIAYRYLWKPWLSQLSDDALCLEVERRNKQLGEGLISAVQFARAKEQTGQNPEVQHVSSDMVDETIRQGIAGAKDVPFESILDQTKFRWNGVMLAICSVMMVLGMASLAFSSSMQTWFARNVLLQDKEWATHAKFEFLGLDKDGAIAIPQGSNWPLLVRMTDENESLPAAVDFDLRSSTGNRTERAERFDQNREYRVMLKRVSSAMEVRARSGRSRTDWVPVRLVTRPTTEALTLEVTPPAYSKLPKQTLPQGEGPYYLLPGSELKVTGTANKAIAKANLIVGEQSHEVPLKGKKLFEIDLNAEQVAATRYRVELEDKEKIWGPTSREFVPLRSQDGVEFTLKHTPDLAPSVKAELIGIGSMVLPGARIPYKCSIEDDFGITASRLKFEWRLDAPDAETQTGSVEIAVPDEAKIAKRFSFEDALSLAEIDVPAGSGFAFEIEANDNDDVSGPKIGRSTKFLLRVVAEEELRANLLRREKELRQEFESILKRQEDILIESEALEAGLEDEATPEQRKSIMEAQRNEKLLSASVQSIADRLSKIIVETQNNQIEPEGGPIEQRLGSQIVQPMRELAEQTLPSITKNLDRVRRQLDEKSERQEALDTAIAEQRAAVDEMRDVLSKMIKSEGFQEAVNLLHQVQQEQRKVADLTEKEKQNRLERILKGSQN